MPGKLFDDVFFFMSRTLAVDQSKQLSKVLSMNGGLSVPLSDDRLTHYITNSYPGEDSLEAPPEDSNVHVVTTKWVERSLVLSTIQDPAFYSPDPAMLFSGIIATSTDLSQSDNEVLCAGISSLGGQWRTAYTKDVTHLFALGEGSAKYATAMHFRGSTGVHILVPHWFDDVVRLGMRNLPTEEYEWPNPKVFVNAGVEAIRKLTGEDGEDIKEIKKPRPLTPHKKALYDTALTDSTDLPTQRPASNKLWNGCKILLSCALGLTKGQYEAHVADIERSGGKIVHREGEADEVEKVEQVDILITRFRSGPVYAKAYRLKKTIGTLAWLWYVRATGVLSRPTDQFLHYPVPRHSVDNFSSHIISITNYTGKDREYVKRLILALGAEFTPSMTGRNTLLIAAYDSGTKMTKARSWNIPVVNHTWLEDCFVQWRNISPANEKYIAFPNSVDFGRVLGEKGLGHVGYNEDELATLENEVATDEDISIRPSLASQPVGETPRRQRRSSTPAKNKSADETADVSAGGYLDIDVPIDDDGRLSDIDVVPEDNDGPPDDDDDRMDLDESPTLRKSARAKAAAKSPGTPKSILKAAKGKAAPTPAESEPEEQPAEASTSRRKLVRRFGRQSNPVPVEEERPKDVSPSKSPSRRRDKTETSPKARAGRANEKQALEEGPSSSHKLLVRRTYGAKSRSRSRSRARNEETASEAEETRATKRTPAKTRPRSRSRSAARDIESEDEDEDDYVPPPPKKVVKTARERSPSRERGRRRGHQSEEDDASPAKPSRGRGRPPTRTRKSDVDEITVSKSPKKITGAITRSRSRSRARELEQAAQEKTKPRSAGTKGRPKAVPRDSDTEDDAIEIAKPKTPAKKPPTSTKASSKRKKPTLPTDSESDLAPPPKRATARRDSLASAPGTEGEGEARTGPTPRREVSVVVPTMKQVRSQSQLRGEGGRAPDAGRRGREASPAKSPSPPPKRGRGRPPKNPSKKPEPTRPSPKDASPSPPPAPAPKTTRRRTMDPPAPVEAGPSTVDVPDTPASSTRSPSKRSAATKATKKLHDEIMPDVLNFQKELKSGHVKSALDQEASKGKGKERSTEADAVGHRKGKKRASGDTDSLEVQDAPERKKQKVNKGRPSHAEGSGGEENVAIKKRPTAQQSSRSPDTSRQVIVLTTQCTFSDDITKQFTKLGAKFTTKPSECTHIVAKHFVRTEKFLCGLAVAKYVVDGKWVEMCALKKQWLPESDYLLKDAAAEAKYGVKLADALRRAKANQGKLFEGMTFYVTPKVPVEFKLLKNVVASGGGQVVAQSPTPRILKGHDGRYVISHENAVSIWRPLAAQGFPIYSQELILRAALKQRIDFESDENKVPGSF